MTLEPGESLSYGIDPRFYCFSDDGATRSPTSLHLTAHYGWPEERRSGPRGPETSYVAWSENQDAHERDIVGNAITLEPNLATSEPETGGRPRSLVLEMVRGSDARTERSVKATVRLRNRGPAPVEVYVRRALLAFQVQGPTGVVSCSSEGEFRHPARLGFTRLSPGASVTLVNRLVELCPRGTFAAPGVYLVTAAFETDATGQSVGLDAFTGQLRTARSASIRVRHAIHLVPNHWVPKVVTAPPTLPAPSATPLPARARVSPRPRLGVKR
jgi:hypothetical protein